MTKHLLYGPRRTARIETYLSLNPNDRLIGYLGKNYDVIERIIAKTESMDFVLGVIRQRGIRDRDGNEVTLEALTNAWETMNAAILRGFGSQNPAPGFPDVLGPPPRWKRRTRYAWPVVPTRKPRHHDATPDQPAGESGHETAGDSGTGSGGIGPEAGDARPGDARPGDDEPTD